MSESHRVCDVNTFHVMRGKKEKNSSNAASLCVLMSFVAEAHSQKQKQSHVAGRFCRSCQATSAGCFFFFLFCFYTQTQQRSHPASALPAPHFDIRTTDRLLHDWSGCCPTAFSAMCVLKLQDKTCLFLFIFFLHGAFCARLRERV